MNGSIVSLYLDSAGVVPGTSGIADDQNISFSEYLTTLFPCILQHEITPEVLRHDEDAHL